MMTILCISYCFQMSPKMFYKKLNITLEKYQNRHKDAPEFFFHNHHLQWVQNLFHINLWCLFVVIYTGRNCSGF